MTDSVIAAGRVVVNPELNSEIVFLTSMQWRLVACLSLIRIWSSAYDMVLS
ncbi:hypothetical protein [Pantoea cypripedii]|uniref:hypothetical protein n=1 Tax=Pantoea cypripedii TaxID=55209 RepID=UPI001301EC37|nr:hypothetical protein [Pantoea cypripedii]MBP2199128.1 multisubunit Na+/H+ antiporter MnhF subunit [Pantoea cypripedii]